MSFEEIAFQYELEFGEKPPILTTLSVDNKDYLRILTKAIDNHKKITLNDLGEVFMTDDNVCY